jgi:carbon-monoxide dehydrogenase medium subunit
MALPEFDYLKADNLEEALAWLGRYGEEARVAGGSTVLLTMLRQMLFMPRYVIGLSEIDALKYIEVKDGLLRIGGLTTHRAIETSKVIRNSTLAVLAEMERDVGSVQLRNRGTIGGNLAYAEPFCDPPCVFVALDAVVKLKSAAGERAVPIGDFYKGYYETVLQPEELISEIQVPVLQGAVGGYYYKFTVRKAMDKPYIGVAAIVTVDETRSVFKDVRIAVGAVAEVPFRAKKAEQLLKGSPVSQGLIEEAGRAAAAGVEVIPDLRCSENYKRKVLPVIVKRAISRALEAVSRAA